MNTNCFTQNENAFAEANHWIIERFLRQKRLRYDDFYDVVVFGFMRAVRQYCGRDDLRQRYTFATIAWRKMTDDLHNHYNKQSRPSRRAVTVSLDAVYGDSGLTMAETIPCRNSSTENMEAALLWDQVSDLLTADQLEILRLRVDGYTDREIAARRKRRVSDIEGVFVSIQTAVLELCMV